MGSEIKKCRSCGTEFRFLRYVKTGRSAPIEVQTSPKGNIFCDKEADTYTIIPPEHLDMMHKEVGLHLDHHVNCPDKHLTKKEWQRKWSSANQPARNGRYHK